MILVSDSNYLQPGQAAKKIAPYCARSSATLRLVRILAKHAGIVIKRFINPLLFNATTEPIVIFDDVAQPKLLKLIAQYNPKARLILWYWQPVDWSISPKKVPPRFELWTYSAADADHYSMRYNSQFFCTNLADLKPQDDVYDFCFIGHKKGRKGPLKKLFRFFQDNGFRTYLHLVPKYSWPRGGKSGRKRRVPYKDYLLIESQSRCIIDYTVNEHAGLSLRPLEAYALNKKIITNCQELWSTEISYNRTLSLADAYEAKTLKAFLCKQVQEPLKSTLDYYSIDAWIARFQ